MSLVKEFSETALWANACQWIRKEAECGGREEKLEKEKENEKKIMMDYDLWLI
jgi:hypothetical protein